MSVVVHVTTPKGTRYEFRFADGTPDGKVLRDLAKNRRVFGYNAEVVRKDPWSGMDTAFEDTDSGLVWDNPDTVVAVVDPAAPDAEVRRLKGPPAAVGV